MNLLSRVHPAVAPAEPPHRGRRLASQACWALVLVLAATEFVVRGPVRASTNAIDFAPVYLSTRAWMLGSDPYDRVLTAQIWSSVAPASGLDPGLASSPSVYLPSAFVLMAPLAILPWEAARVAWLGIGSVLALCAIAALSRATGLRWRDWTGRLYWILALGLAPLHTGLALGNLAILAAAAALIGFWATLRGRDSIAGVLLGLSVCVKPQVGGVVWLACAFQRRWRPCAIALAVILVVAGVAVGRLEGAHVRWLAHWMAVNLPAIAPTAGGGGYDPTSANLTRHGLLNAHMALYALFEQRWIVNVIVATLTGALLVVFAVAHRTRLARRHSVLAASALAIISMVPIYHRSYDATLLLLPLAWSLAQCRSATRTWPVATLVLILPFLAPGAVVLEQWFQAGRLPAAWGGQWWWNVLALPHQAWAVLLLAFVLTGALTARTAGQDPDPAEHQ